MKTIKEILSESQGIVELRNDSVLGTFMPICLTYDTDETEDGWEYANDIEQAEYIHLLYPTEETADRVKLSDITLQYDVVYWEPRFRVGSRIFIFVSIIKG